MNLPYRQLFSDVQVKRESYLKLPYHCFMNISTFAIVCFVTHNLFTTAVVCGKESFCSERLVIIIVIFIDIIIIFCDISFLDHNLQFCKVLNITKGYRASIQVMIMVMVMMR